MAGYRGGVALNYLREQAGSPLLAICSLPSMKIAAGIISGSLAVLSDGIDSATDVLIAMMTIIASRITSKPGDREHPYGHGRAETVTTAVISFILFFAAAQILLKAIGGIMSGASQELPTQMALIVTIISIAGKLALSWSQFYFGKKAVLPCSSPMQKTCAVMS